MPYGLEKGAYTIKQNDWHRGFYGALGLSFEEYGVQLMFEHQLTAGSLRIDAIIFNRLNRPIDTDVGRLFRGVNLLEYKRPGVTVTMADFRKVRAYAELYGSQNAVKITDMSISVAVFRYPRKLLGELKRTRGYKVSNPYKGVYYIRGCEIPTQIIVTPKLDDSGNMWLKHLSGKLTAESLKKIIALSEAAKNRRYLEMYMQLLCEANPNVVKEVIKKMGKRFERVLEETGLTAKWEARGRAEGETRGRAEGEARGRAEGEARGRAEGEVQKALAIAKKLIRKGWNAEEIAETAELDLDTVRRLCLEP